MLMRLTRLPSSARLAQYGLARGISSEHRQWALAGLEADAGGAVGESLGRLAVGCPGSQDEANDALNGKPFRSWADPDDRAPSSPR